MIGQIPKRISSFHLACCECKHFRDDDPDIFYCEITQKDFPALCEKYESKKPPSLSRNFFIGVDQ